MTEIAITGANGKMGRVIARIIEEREDCRVVGGIDLQPSDGLGFPVVKNIFDLPQKPDVVVDFSHPSALEDVLSYCKMKNVPAVIATTGYTDEQIDEIKAAAGQIPIFFTFNLSLGINLLADLAKRAAQVLGMQFDVEIIEKHHNLKKDAPSGTALMLAESVNEVCKGEKKYIYDRHNVRKARERGEIGISSVRGGTIVGEHDIIFAGHDEVITLSHSAQSKEVFAVGAVNAAVFLKDKDPGLYDMSDLLKD